MAADVGGVDGRTGKELGRQTVPGDNRQQARKLVAALAHYMGGRSYYLPSGDRLMNALRDDQIYSRFDGRNVEQLSCLRSGANSNLYHYRTATRPACSPCTT